jgi:hypothetical protein
MGNTISNSLADTMVSKQKEMQTEMMQKQQDLQLRLGERQRRMMVTGMLAQQRETFWWLSGSYGTILTGVVAFAKIKGS